MKLGLIVILTLVGCSVSYPQRHRGYSHRRRTRRPTSQPRLPGCRSNASLPDPAGGCCGVDAEIQNRIVGGGKTGLRQYPWLALIEYKDILYDEYDKDIKCGGSLISGKYVLTAAHCVTGAIVKNAKPVSVRLGDYYLRNGLHDADCVKTTGNAKDCIKGAVSIKIESLIPHRRYNDEYHRNDIALIRLAWTARFTDVIRPICLPGSDVTVNAPPNLKLHTAGWGVVFQKFYRNGERKDYLSDTKRHISLPFVPLDECKKHYRSAVSNRSICAGGEPGKGTCLGDSGGPLMDETNGRFDLVGIVSFGSGASCIQKNTSDVFTKVYSFVSWIRHNMHP